MEIFRRYKLVKKIINSTVLNKLQSYSRISALGPEGHCTSRFRRAMCISCRQHVDVHKVEGGLAHVDAWGQRRRGQNSDFFVDVINGWPLRIKVTLTTVLSTLPLTALFAIALTFRKQRRLL